MTRQHLDSEVQAAVIRLCDALCQWERATGRSSVLILVEQGVFKFRAMDGKPNVPEYMSDGHLLAQIK
jgi:hypothetical protein